jgi:hypothetical protein
MHGSSLWPGMAGNFHGCVEVCRLLIEHGARPECQASRALMVAAGGGHLEVCRLLLEHGAEAGAGQSSTAQLATLNNYLMKQHDWWQCGCTASSQLLNSVSVQKK